MMSDFGPSAAFGRCFEWLEAEERCRISKNHGLSVVGSPGARLDAIVNRVAPYAWDEFQRSRRRDDSLRASHYMLKLCAATQEGAIIGAMERGGNYQEARWAVAHNLRESSTSLTRRVAMHASRLDRPFDRAFGGTQYSTETLYVGLLGAVGLAVAHMVERINTEGMVTLPAPGQPMNPGKIISEWNLAL